MSTAQAINVGAADNDGTGDPLRTAFRKLNAQQGINSPMPGTAFYNVQSYGATGDGVTNDTTAIIAALTAMPSSGASLYFPNAVYRIDSTRLYGLLFGSKDNFSIIGNGSTIKVLDGESCSTQYNMMTFQNCTDGYIENLFLDGNRSNRSINFPSPQGAYTVQVQDGCQRLLFNNVRAINSCIDGFSVIVASAQFGNISAYPTDITFQNCLADNSVRVGMGVINSVRCRILGGRYQNTNGSEPLCGIDVEPDFGFTSFGNIDCSIIGAETSGNAGFGIATGGPTTAPNTNVVIDGLRGRDNAYGLLNISSAVGINIRNIECGIHPTATRGIIDINTFATKVRVSGVSMIGVTASLSANAGVYVHSAVADTPYLENLRFVDVACKTLWINRRTVINGYSGLGCTYSPEIQLVAGDSELRDAISENATGVALYVEGVDVTIDGFSAVDPGSISPIYMAVTAVRSTVRNVKLRQRTSIPGGQIALYYDVIPGVIQNFEARSAGTDYTTANAYVFTLGIAGAQISGLTPGPIAVSADRGDANVTLVNLIDAYTQRFATVLTANRTVTLSATNAALGANFRVSRTGLGAFTLDVGGLKTIPAGTAAFVDVAHDGTAWRLTGYGTL